MIAYFGIQSKIHAFEPLSCFAVLRVYHPQRWQPPSVPQISLQVSLVIDRQPWFSTQEEKLR